MVDLIGQDAKVTLSVVLPCLNEEQTIGICIHKIQEVFHRNEILGEIIVCDNGSTDNSIIIAQSMGVIVVHQPLRGYGNTYIKGFSRAKGKYIIMGDSDNTYDFYQIPRFLRELDEEGFDFVTGSRFLSSKSAAHDPFLHRVLGNPAITLMLNLMFRTNYTDVYCGFRGFTKEAYQKISPVSPGMEFNLELAINAGLAKLNIKEISIDLAPRQGESKLRTFYDGWRSLRMMLLYSPNSLFLIPGFFLLTVGMIIHAVVLLEIINYQGRNLGLVASTFATIFSSVGFQTLNLGLHAKTYSWSRRFDRENLLLRKFYKLFKLESGLILGTLMSLFGLVILSKYLIGWVYADLSPLKNPEWISFSATLIIIGFGIISSSLFISTMSIRQVEESSQNL